MSRWRRPRRGGRWAARVLVGCAATLVTLFAASWLSETAHAATATPRHAVGLWLWASTDTLPGLSALRFEVAAGTPVEFRYVVVNPGPFPVEDVTVSARGVPDDSIHCEGRDNTITWLPALSVARCVATLDASAGEFVSVVRATGSVYGLGFGVGAAALTGYRGFAAGLRLSELVDGRHTSGASPSRVRSGTSLDIRYQFTNTGDVDLRDPAVRDSLVGGANSPDCGFTVLAPGATGSCSARLSAAGGAHVGHAAATATEAVATLLPDGSCGPGGEVTGYDSAAYDGVSPARPQPVVTPTHTPSPASVAPPAPRPTPAPPRPSPSPSPPPPVTMLVSPADHPADKLPWLSVMFLVVFVPAIVVVARAIGRGGR